MDPEVKNQLDRIETMVTDLVRIVGHTNGRLTNLSDQVQVLQQDVAELKQDVAVLKQDVAVLKQDVAELKQEVATLNERQNRMEKTLEKMAEDQRSICEMYGRHEIEIINLRRRPV